MKHIKGDLLKLAREGAFDVIAHGCNCFCTMGAGIAKGVATYFPQAYDADLRTSKGDRAKLGTCTTADIATDRGTLIVVNAYTQYDFRGPGVKADYGAIRSCMGWIARSYPRKRVGLPKIGAGLAGGDWPTIEAIIDEEFGSSDVTVIEYQTA